MVIRSSTDVRLLRVLLSIALAALLPLASPGSGGGGEAGDTPHSRQKRVLWITNDGRLALPPGTTMVITPSISMPLVRYPPHGFLSNMTVSFPFTIDFDKLGLTDNENPYGTLPPLFDHSFGRAAGSALADYLARYLERRRGRREAADAEGAAPEVERAFLDRLHGGERYTLLFGRAAGSALADYLERRRGRREAADAVGAAPEVERAFLDRLHGGERYTLLLGRAAGSALADYLARYLEWRRGRREAADAEGAAPEVERAFLDRLHGGERYPPLFGRAAGSVLADYLARYLERRCGRREAADAEGAAPEVERAFLDRLHGGERYTPLFGRAAGSALADYLARYLERRRGRREAADAEGAAPEVERAFLDRLHGGERYTLLFGRAAGSALADYLARYLERRRGRREAADAEGAAPEVERAFLDRLHGGERYTLLFGRAAGSALADYLERRRGRREAADAEGAAPEVERAFLDRLHGGERYTPLFGRAAGSALADYLARYLERRRGRREAADAEGAAPEVERAFLDRLHGGERYTPLFGRAAGSALADYLARYLERRRGRREAAGAEGAAPEVERAFLDRLHGGERAILYGLAEDLLANFGWAGRECLLRAICEVHAHPLANFGFLGEVLRLFFTPSKSPYAHLLAEYIEAQRAGEQRGECFPYYRACPRSIFLPGGGAGADKYSKEAEDLHRREKDTDINTNEIKAM